MNGDHARLQNSHTTVVCFVVISVHLVNLIQKKATPGKAPYTIPQSFSSTSQRHFYPILVRFKIPLMYGERPDCKCFHPTLVRFKLSC